MATYTYAELEGLWINAGGPRALAPIAAAIAEAESGGNSTALNPSDNGGTQSSFGLWQISNGTHTPPSANWSDPAVNAQLAVGKWKGAGDAFTPWGTYVSGAYKRFLSGRTTPNTNVPGGSAGAGGTGTGAGGTGTATLLAYNPASCLWSFPGVPVPFLGNIGTFCILTKAEVRSWIGAGLLAGGAVMMLPGVFLLVAAAGMRALGAGGPVLEKTGAAVALIPGAEGAGVAIAAAGKAGAASAQQTQRRRTARRNRGGQGQEEETFSTEPAPPAGP